MNQIQWRVGRLPRVTISASELRSRRRSLGLTQVQLSAALGVTSTTVARWERGERPVGSPGSVQLALERLEGVASISHDDGSVWQATVQAQGERGSSDRSLRAVRAPGRLSYLPRLPNVVSSFVGREREMVNVIQLLGTSRLVTLTGPGGVGKTRLALRVACDLSEQFAHRAVFVPLAAISDPACVLATIARHLGVWEQHGNMSVLELLQEALHDAQILIVLDNFEQVLPAAPALAQLLSTCAGLRVMVTSRAMLRVSGEHTFDVPSLRLPEAPSLEQVGHFEAVRLFVERAQAVKPDFDVTDDTATIVADICRRLDGLPLAIELAAARVRVLPPASIFARLGQCLDLLVGGARDAPERHQTLRRALAWSYDLLTSHEQRVFRQLGVFVGGWTLEAAESVGAVAGQQSRSGAAPDMLATLSSLVDQGVVQVDEQTAGLPRFRLLETLRAYALDRLVACGEDADARRRHAAFFLTFAEELGTEDRTRGADGQACLDRLERDHDNLRAALRWALDSGNPEVALRMAQAVQHLWNSRGYYTEGRRWMDEVLALSEGRARTSARSALLYAAARIAHRQGDLAMGGALQAEALSIAREVGDHWLEAGALFGLGFNASRRADFAASRAFTGEALRLYRSTGDRLREAMSLSNLSVVAWQEQDYATARVNAAEALRLGRELNSPLTIAQALKNLGCAAFGQGDGATAEAALTESLTVARQVGERWLIAYLLEYLGLLAASLGKHAEARLWFLDGIRAHLHTGERPGVVRCLEGLASVSAAETRPDEALQLASAATAAREAMVMPRSPREQRLLEPWLIRAQQALGRDGAERARAAGRALSLDQASALAFRISHSADPTPVDTHPDNLTPRERQVLQLVGGGHTNTEIANELVLSVRTVERHVANVYAKIGARGRAGAVAYAVHHHLI